VVGRIDREHRTHAFPFDWTMCRGMNARTLSPPHQRARASAPPAAAAPNRSSRVQPDRRNNGRTGAGDEIFPLRSHTMKTSAICLIAVLSCAAGAVLAEGPLDYPAEQAQSMSPKSRAQVRAELAEAQRLGLLSWGELDTPIATPEQEQQIADAGVRARADQVAAK
jgi:hypothetical protein